MTLTHFPPGSHSVSFDASLTKNIVFSAVWSWCTKPKVKDSKLKLKHGKHWNSAHRTDIFPLRLAFNENDITHISMWIWLGHPNSYILQFLQSLGPISQLLRSLFQNSSHSEHNSSLCGLNCGSFNDHIFKMSLFSHSYTTITKTICTYRPICTCLHTLFKTNC